MESIKNEYNIAKTECGHSFHFQCLIRWSQSHNNCPLCRQEFVKKEIVEPELPWNYRFDGESDINYIARITHQPEQKIEQALRYYKGDVQKTLDVMDVDDQRHLNVPIPPFANNEWIFADERHNRYWIPPPKNRIRPRSYIGKEYIYQTRIGTLQTRRVNLSKLRHDVGVNDDPLEVGYRSA